jgi:hypothetical protein
MLYFDSRLNVTYVSITISIAGMESSIDFVGRIIAFGLTQLDFQISRVIIITLKNDIAHHENLISR